MRTKLQEKETIHFSITIWYTNLILCLKQWRYPQQKQQWIMGETWQDSGVGPDISQKQISGDRWSKDEGRKGSFCLTDGYLSEECRIGGKTPKIQRSSCTPRRHCERWFRILCSIHRTRIISISNDGSKSDWFYFKTTGMRRTSSWCSICLYPGNNGRCSKIVENSQIGMSRH